MTEDPGQAQRRHLHDGFFLRLGFGISYTISDFRSAVGTRSDVSGWGGAFEVLMGGSPLPGLVLGGAALGYWVLNADVEIAGQPVRGDDVKLAGAAMLFQYYPDPRGGLFLQALFGMASGAVAPADYELDDSMRGILVGAGGGWETWVGDQWSVGAAARLIYAEPRSGRLEGTDRYRMWWPALMFVATYH